MFFSSFRPPRVLLRRETAVVVASASPPYVDMSASDRIRSFYSSVRRDSSTRFRNLSPESPGEKSNFGFSGTRGRVNNRRGNDSGLISPFCYSFVTIR